MSNKNSPSDIIEFYGQDMTRDWADALRGWQKLTHYTRNGIHYPRIPYGEETFRNPVEASRTGCRYCKTIQGRFHEPRCDYEQCPACDMESLTCECEYDGIDVNL